MYGNCSKSCAAPVIAMIPYANMAPFQEMGPPRGCVFMGCSPRESIAALRSGQISAAALPVGGLQALEDIVEPAGLFGIAAKAASLSVLFFSDRDFNQFNGENTLRLTGESASSVRLLFLLLGYQSGFSRLPAQVAASRPANGELVIGDAALDWMRRYEQEGSVQGFRFVTDLATRWYGRFRLPFVFARWVVHRNAPHRFKRVLRDWLASFSDREPTLIEKAAPKVARRLELPESFVRDYFRIVRRCLTPEDIQGQQMFLAEFQRCQKEHPYPWICADTKKDEVQSLHC